MNKNVVLIIRKQYLTENKSDNIKRQRKSRLITRQTALDKLLFLVYCVSRLLLFISTLVT